MSKAWLEPAVTVKAKQLANEEHVRIIRQGAQAWNAWRKKTPEIRPNLNRANLSEAKLEMVNLSEADLREVDFSGAYLVGADLFRACLRGARLNRSNLVGAVLMFANLHTADLREADLRESNLLGADLSSAFLNSARLSGANLSKSSLRKTNLEGADLSRTNLSEANLHIAKLGKADLRGANLGSVNLSQTDLSEADFNGARLAWTLFVDTDLSTVHGLTSVRHDGPSTIGIDSLYKSDGKIPKVFLRDAGVPEDFITYVSSLVGQAIEFYSCFISYSHEDDEFSRCLHSRMRSENLRVWYAPEHMKGGRKLHEEIFSAIQIHDKLLLVLSEHSMKSKWVTTEILRARKVEREEDRRKLFPIRLVDLEAIRKWECFDADSGEDLAVELRKYYIPDFSNWKDHDAFEAEFAKLLRDLKATEK